MTLANVALTNTFETWRVRTNETLNIVNGLQDGSGFANVASLKIQGLGANGQFLKIANSASGEISASAVTPTFSDLTGVISAGQFPGTLSLTANTTLGGTKTVVSSANTMLNTSFVTFGAPTSLKISGGSSNQVLTTNGSGALSWAVPVVSDGAITNVKIANNTIDQTKLATSGPTANTVFLRGDYKYATISTTNVSGLGTAATQNTGTSGANVPLMSTDNTWSGSQRITITTDNDGSFDLDVSNDFKCTPTGAVVLTFTNHAAQKGDILFINGSNYAVTAAATTKINSADLTTLSATGTYRISYMDDGTNAYCVISKELTS